MVKKKLAFIKLSAFFGMITLLTIFFLWGNKSSTTSPASMMGQSMGDMMSGEHLQDITVRELILQQDQIEESQDIDSQASHHSSEGFLKTAHYLSTATIVILLPFILAGTIFLAIIWLNTKSEVKR
ncbi:MAG: hypothetical protein CVU84_10330 [Firmicutes bacterium HGW-Firmicutes-1]|nr:MAG: hypothetical protein CVU84_10330 [Firmicutes bacterium HGW-Firmicutes-1]